MNRIQPPSSAPMASPVQPSDWRKLPVSAASTDPAQQITASIAYSVEPSWYVQVRGEASRGGKATLELNRERLEVTIAPQQPAGATVSLFKKALEARGYTVSVSGNEKPTPAELAVLKAHLSQALAALRKHLPEGERERLETQVDILRSRIASTGSFTLVVDAPK